MKNDVAINVDFFGRLRKAIEFLALAVLGVAVVTAFFLRWKQERYRTGEVIIDNRVTVSVKVADTPDKRQKGLTIMDSLADGDGMLFEFPHPDRYSFWMKDMKFPIDIIWLMDEEIMDFSLNIQPVGEGDAFIPAYEPAVSVNRVLEVPAGFVASHDLRLGNNVIYRIDTK